MDAGLCDLLTESEIISAESVDGILKGKHYNRAVHVHKSVAEALFRL